MMTYLLSNWCAINTFSRAFTSAIPTRGNEIPSAYWWEVWADYMACPSPGAAAMVGKVVPNMNRRLSHSGHEAVASSGLNVGGSITVRHDELKWVIADACRSMKLPTVCEVYGLFAAYVSQAQSAAFMQMDRRARQILEPDFMFTPHGRAASLADLKFITFCPSRYKTGPQVNDFGTQSAAVNRRADLVNSADAGSGGYHEKAHKGDVRWNGTAAGARGPIQVRLDSFGRVKGFAAGAFGECSDDVAHLVADLANSGAESSWMDMGARSKREARGIIKHQLTKSFGVTTVRANAACKLLRLGVLASGDAKSAAARRSVERFNMRVRQDWWHEQSAARRWGRRINGGPGGVQLGAGLPV
jgi:hypothetical protein